MNRNDGAGAGPGGTFQEGTPGTGLLAAKVPAKWTNALQAEYEALVLAAGLTLDDTNNAQLLAAMQILFSAGNTSAVLKNRVINGGFDLWQRGASFAIGTGNFFTADRWCANPDPSGAGTATISQQTFGVGQTDVPGGPTFYLRWLQTVNATAIPVLFQTIEDVARYSSGQITVSFRARAGANLNAGISVIQNFGSGGSTAVTVGVTAIAVTTAWQRFTATLTLPSVAGKTIGPANYLRVGVRLPQASTYTFEIADFQVEVGNAASSFDRRPLQLEYLLAARYYEKSYGVDVAPGTLTRAGSLQRPAPLANTAPTPCTNLREQFRVPKRSVPTITWYAPVGTVGNPGGAGKISMNDFAAGYVGVDVVATTGTNENTTGYPTRGDLTTGYPFSPTPHFALIAQWTADAELL